MKVLVTGGAGYIGSVTATALEAAGHEPIVLDSLEVGAEAFVRDRTFYRGDVADRELLRRIVDEHPDLDCTIHLAARTVVPESVAEPALYHRVNVAGTLALADTLAELGRPGLVFSSSASVYAPSESLEVDEHSALAPTSPYARTKVIGETILRDLADAGRLRVLALRYFNPVGSDPGLRSGVHVREPSHVLGRLLRVAQGIDPAFTITGTDYPTRDGTGIRDYVHVWDVALAHVAAVERLEAVLDGTGRAFEVVNIGTGTGTTVRELVAAFEHVQGRPVPVVEGPPRPGDAAGAYANVDRARELLGWTSRSSLDQAIASALAWGERRRAVLGYD